ncbi:RNA-binding motif protein, X-linked 2 isoform X2 [Ambystoma mexicanum]|uniref:RNA-binding motif protein, X-linked 2 isoform X2 n=1 Tax=Ambystoma mexicanum TaxID=8296 RepID=UPI0037E75AFB
MDLSRYGEIVNINLVRDQKTGKSKGFCFICYEDQRSTILAVDNFNGIKIKGRTIRVDHVANYRPPKDTDDIDDVTKALREKGCGVKTPPPSSSESSSEDDLPAKKQKDKKEKRKKKKEKKKLKREERNSVEEQSFPRGRTAPQQTKIKKEKDNPEYDKYAAPPQEAKTHRNETKECRDGSKAREKAQEVCDIQRVNERSHGRESVREQQKDGRLKDERSDKRFNYRTDRGHMNTSKVCREDKRDNIDRREDRQRDQGWIEDRLDDQGWREDRPDDRGYRGDTQDNRFSKPVKSKESYRESSNRYENHYETHSSRRDGHPSNSDSYAYGNQYKERSERRGYERHNSRDQYGVSDNKRY